MLDTTPNTTESTRLITAGTAEQTLLVAVAQLFPNLTSAEFATSAAERKAVSAKH